MNDLKGLDVFLMSLCDAAAKETLPRFRSGVSVANKGAGGFDPVTEADRAAEQAIRRTISKRFPGHTIVGEEFGTSIGSEDYTWVLDPIDGTRAFVSGLPVWGTLIALQHEGIGVAGVMDQPFTGERFWSTGDGSYLVRGDETRELKTSGVTELSQATLMTSDPRLFLPRGAQRFALLESAVQMSRYGADCYAHAMVAAGEIEMVAESGLKSYDIAALIPVIEGAGGVVTTWEGGSAANGGDVLSSANEALHAKALAILAG